MKYEKCLCNEELQRGRKCDEEDKRKEFFFCLNLNEMGFGFGWIFEVM